MQIAQLCAMSLLHARVASFRSSTSCVAITSRPSAAEPPAPATGATNASHFMRLMVLSSHLQFAKLHRLQHLPAAISTGAAITRAAPFAPLAPISAAAVAHSLRCLVRRRHLWVPTLLNLQLLYATTATLIATPSFTSAFIAAIAAAAFITACTSVNAPPSFTSALRPAIAAAAFLSATRARGPSEASAPRPHAATRSAPGAATIFACGRLSAAAATACSWRRRGAQCRSEVRPHRHGAVVRSVGAGQLQAGDLELHGHPCEQDLTVSVGCVDHGDGDDRVGYRL
mmetsp:Transcript_61194/g.167920  ORF Transcript_61194/g.167920 Transcript_61194/m.167920 type:complete len:285 (-) Transcript_61194:167-1021(-)